MTEPSQPPGFFGGPRLRIAAYLFLLSAVGLNVYQRVRGERSETLQTLALVLLVLGAGMMLARLFVRRPRR